MDCAHVVGPLPVAAVDHHIGAGRGQLQRNRPADAASAAGDDGSVIVESIHGYVSGDVCTGRNGKLRRLCRL